MARILFIILIIICANKLFYLVPWAHVHGVFNITDVGAGLIIIALGFTLLKQRDLSVLNNPISFLILALFLILGIHVALARIHFNQSFISGLFGIRHFSYYLLFFLALLWLKTADDYIKILNILSVIAFLLFLISVVNYFRPGLYHHMWVEGHGTRSGIKRAFIPGMSIICLALLWEYSKWTIKVSNRSKNALAAFVLLAAHFFEQTKGRILAMVFVILLMFGWKRGMGFGSNLVLMMFVTAAVISGVTLFEKAANNIMLSPIALTVRDVTEQRGTWGARLEQIEIDWREFLEHPIVGSGLSAVRIKKNQRNLSKYSVLKAKAQKADLGYTHWLKFFGIVGVVWLIAFFYNSWSILRIAIQDCSGKEQMIALLASSYLGYVAISFITLNHFMFPCRIVLLSLVAAAVVRLRWNKKYAKTNDLN